MTLPLYIYIYIYREREIDRYIYMRICNNYNVCLFIFAIVYFIHSGNRVFPLLFTVHCCDACMIPNPKWCSKSWAVLILWTKWHWHLIYCQVLLKDILAIYSLSVAKMMLNSINQLISQLINRYSGFIALKNILILYIYIYIYIFQMCYTTILCSLWGLLTLSFVIMVCNKGPFYAPG